MEFIGHLPFVTGGSSGMGEQICRDLAPAGASVVVADLQSKQAQDVAASLPTGGASGIGEQVCRDLAEAGASVVVADLQLKRCQDVAASLPTGEGRQHLAVSLDVSKKSQVESALSQVIKTYGTTANLIVNCAGITGEGAPIEDMKEEEFDRVIDVNFKGTFLVTQVFGKALLDTNKPGAIVNLSSILAYLCFSEMSHYCASKAAVMQFTKAAAWEWGPKGIRANSVHPGLVDTPMTEYAKESPLWKAYEARSALRRVGKPKDVSEAVVFLLSNRSGFVTGTHLEVSGLGPEVDKTNI